MVFYYFYREQIKTMGEVKMKKIMILFAVLLIGAGATSGALTSASFGWTLKEVNESAFFTLDKEGYQYGNITFELSDGPLVWIDPDEIEDSRNISIEITRPITSAIKLYTDRGTYFPGEPVLITIKNNGDKDACYCGSYNHWTIEQYQYGDWKRIFPPAEILIILNDCISPREKEEGLWNSTNNPGDYRVAVSYFIGEEKYKFTEYAYFLITTFFIPIDNKIFGNYTLELPDYPLVWKDQDDVSIPLPPMQKISMGDLPAISIGEIPLGKYCNVTDSITIYNITDSIKIYNPYGGYWWFPIFPYLVDD